MIWQKARLGLLLLAATFLAACAGMNPLTGQPIFVLSSPQEEAQLGQALFNQLVAQRNLTGEVMNRNESTEAKRLYAMVDRVLPRISKAASEYPDVQRTPWSCVILKSDTVDAGALPGNTVILWQGIFKVAPDEPSLGVILGHEVAHVIARHGAQRQAQSELISSIGNILLEGVAKGSPQAVDTAARIYGLTTQIGVASPFSREHESEADKYGLALMAKAGYDPRVALKVWERIQAQAERRSLEFLSTHPSSETRMKDIEGWLPEALVFYQKADRPAAIKVKSGETY